MQGGFRKGFQIEAVFGANGICKGNRKRRDLGRLLTVRFRRIFVKAALQSRPQRELSNWIKTDLCETVLQRVAASK